MSNCFDKNGKQLTLQEMFALWDQKEYAYDAVTRGLLLATEGDDIADLFQQSTVCPVNNSTCNVYFTINFTGYNPDLGHRHHEVRVCPKGAKNMGQCMLSK